MSELEHILDLLADKIAARLNARLAGAPSPSLGDPLMTAAQAAKYLHCGPQKVRNLVNAGVLLRVKGFGEIRIRRSTLDAYGK